MLIDAHTHLTPQQVRHKELMPENMLLLVNTATAQEAQWLFGAALCADGGAAPLGGGPSRP